MHISFSVGFEFALWRNEGKEWRNIASNLKTKPKHNKTSWLCSRFFAFQARLLGFIMNTHFKLRGIITLLHSFLVTDTEGHRWVIAERFFRDIPVLFHYDLLNFKTVVNFEHFLPSINKGSVTAE